MIPDFDDWDVPAPLPVDQFPPPPIESLPALSLGDRYQPNDGMFADRDDPVYRMVERIIHEGRTP